jgi:hypothetical protein
VFWVVAPCGWVFAFRHFQASYVPSPSLGPPSVPYSGHGVSFRGVEGVKRPGRGVDNTFPFSADVKERVQLYLTPSRYLSGRL